ncbi:MAG: DUF2884 family protein [Dokdonella sp.]
MKRVILAAAVGALFATAARAEIDIHAADCGLHSDYSLSVNPDSLEFRRKSGKPADIVIANGSLRVDGLMLDVSAADRQRLLDIEHGVRDTLPEVKAIAHEAIAIAIDAVTEVSAAFAKDGEAARASAQHLARTARELDQRIAESNNFSDWKEGDIDRLVESVAGTLVSEVVGNVAGQAITVALSGDEKAAAELEARADGIDKKIERIVERRSKELERRAEGLCPRLHTLASVASGLDVRLADGRRLDLVRLDR